MELEGPYLRAMQEISARLMNNLPAGDELWQVLGQAEALLIEAQLQGVHPDKVFGNGGVAGFCQSIMDEFEQARRAAEGDEPPTHTPAADDPSTRRRIRDNDPRGGINYRRKRIFSAFLAVVLALLFTWACLWYVGVWRYWTEGSGFYLQELYNFTFETVKTDEAPPTVTLPLSVTSGLNQVLYADGLYTVTLTGLDFHDHAEALPNKDGPIIAQTVHSWSIRLEYTVLADFSTVSYVEPVAEGTATVTLADGTVLTGKLSHRDSGPVGEGREYAVITVVDIPASTSVAGATLTVSLDPPQLVTWERISTGRR